MSDPLLDTPAFREAVEAARKSPPMDGWERPEVEVVLLAAAPHLERHFRAKLAEELRAYVERERADWTRRNVFVAPEFSVLAAADHLERGTP